MTSDMGRFSLRYEHLLTTWAAQHWSVERPLWSRWPMNRSLVIPGALESNKMSFSVGQLSQTGLPSDSSMQNDRFWKFVFERSSSFCGDHEHWISRNVTRLLTCRAAWYALMVVRSSGWASAQVGGQNPPMLEVIYQLHNETRLSFFSSLIDWLGGSNHGKRRGKGTSRGAILACWKANSGSSHFM